MNTSKSFYDVLDVPVNASSKDIRKAYLKLIVSEHPDKGGTKERFELLQKAYNTLSDYNERRIYDEKHLQTPLGLKPSAGLQAYRSNSQAHSKDGTTSIVHGQVHYTDSRFVRKGASIAGQGDAGCDGNISALNTHIEQARREMREDPLNKEAIRRVADAHVDRGMYYISIGKLHHARFDLEEALHECPDHDEARNELATVEKLSLEQEAAIQAFDDDQDTDQDV